MRLNFQRKAPRSPPGLSGPRPAEAAQEIILLEAHDDADIVREDEPEIIRLHASLQYISRFRHPSKLVSEAPPGYWRAQKRVTVADVGLRGGPAAVSCEGLVRRRSEGQLITTNSLITQINKSHRDNETRRQISVPIQVAV